MDKHSTKFCIDLRLGVIAINVLQPLTHLRTGDFDDKPVTTRQLCP